jgi:hypothetical protein
LVLAEKNLLILVIFFVLNWGRMGNGVMQLGLQADSSFQ